MPSSNVLTNIVEALSAAATLESMTKIVAEGARQIAGAQGATFVLRDEDKCFYADEDAISPLWKGKRFPLESCISGWCMLNRETVYIRDIYQDPRIPHDAYRPTFVKSLYMVPICTEEPVGAIGSYWSADYEPTNDQIKLLQMLANTSATGLENLKLRRELARRETERDNIEFQLRSLAHDLKNPLATLLGFAELLEERLKKTGDEKDRQYAASILKVGNRLNKQIEKILSLYRLSSATIKKQYLDLAPFVHDIVAGLKVQDPSRKVEVFVGENLKVMADPVLVRLALENLISNAFKYSGREDLTWIKIDRVINNSAEFDEIVIEDKGAGFDPQKARNLFRPLVRLHDYNEFPGTGLGLSSVARIIELHGGQVRAEGKLSEGAKFYFTLPK